MDNSHDQGHGEKIGGQDNEKKKEGEGTVKEIIDKTEDTKNVGKNIEHQKETELEKSTEENTMNEDDRHLGSANAPSNIELGGTTGQSSHSLHLDKGEASHPPGAEGTAGEPNFPIGGFGGTSGQSSFPLGGTMGSSNFPLGGTSGEDNFPLGGDRSNFSMGPSVQNVFELGGDIQGDNIHIGPQIKDNSRHLHQHLHQDLHQEVHQHFYIGGEQQLGGVGGGLSYSGTSSTRAGDPPKQNSDPDNILGTQADIDTSDLAEVIGKSAINIMLEATKEDYFTMKILSKFSQKLQVQEDFIKAQQKNLGKPEILLTVLKRCVVKPNFSMQMILKAADYVSGLEKLASELRYNEKLIEKAAYQMCDSDNMKEITILLMERFKIPLPVVNKNEGEDAIAKAKRKMEADVKNLIYTFPSATNILNDVINVCTENKLFKDAEKLSTLVIQTEREKEEWLSTKIFIKKLRQTNTILQIHKIKKEETPFNATSNSKLFKAYSPIYPGQTLAVKELSYDKGQMTSILKEININKSLHHPNILSIYGCAIQETKRVIWLVMPYIVGSTLQDLLRERNLNSFEKTNISCGVASALSYLHAHQKGIIHGDVKLSNIMVKENTSEAILLDFGISTYTNLTTTATQAINTTLQGTMEYLAPELLLGHAREATPASDIWSAGCVISQVFAPSSEPLWKVDANSDRNQEIRMLLETGQCPSIYHTVDLSIKHIVKKCFAIDPTERLSSGKLREKLEGILQSLPPTVDAALQQSTPTDDIADISSSDSEFGVQILTTKPSSKDQNQYPTTRNDQKLSSKVSIQRSRRTNMNETDVKQKFSRKKVWVAAGSCMLTLIIAAVIIGVTFQGQNKSQPMRNHSEDDRTRTSLHKIPGLYFKDGGCYEKFVSPTSVESLYNATNADDVDDCRRVCSERNFTLSSFSKESTQTCFCHRDLPPVHKLRPNEYCNSGCNSSDSCGRKTYYTVFRTVEDSGCYEYHEYHIHYDDSFQYLNNTSNWQDKDKTKHSYNINMNFCINYCLKNESSSYAGVAGGEYCRCGNTSNSLTLLTPYKECNLPCAGDATQICGGFHPTAKTLNSRQNIYNTDIKDRDEGCYNRYDNNRRWILRDNKTKLSNNSIQICKELCTSLSFTYAGLTLGDWCACGNNPPHLGGLKPKSECNINCPGDPNSKCGGLFTMTVVNTIQIGGCYKYDTNEESFDAIVSLENLTVDKCIKICKEKKTKFSSVFNGSDCLCFLKPPKYLIDYETCDKVCPGDQSQNCGGVASMNVFRAQIEICRTISGENKNVPCVFPFWYEDKEYNECASGGEGHWCHTLEKKEKPETFKLWGVCDPEVCPIEKKMKEKIDIINIIRPIIGSVTFILIVILSIALYRQKRK